MNKITTLVFAIGIALITSACGVSESEYKEVVAERDALKRGLEEAQQENEVLNEAILEIYKEREALLAQIEELKVANELAENQPTEPPEERRTARRQPEPEPAAQPEPEPEPEPDEGEGPGEYYLIKRNDTLNKIAQKTGVSKQKLMALNNIENEAFIMAGQRLKLTGDARSASNTPSRTSRPSPPPEPAPQPRPTRQPEAERPSPSPTSGRILFYYVKPGENLQAISRRTGVPVDTLKRLNNINESTVLTVGQRLRLQ